MKRLIFLFAALTHITINISARQINFDYGESYSVDSLQKYIYSTTISPSWEKDGASFCYFFEDESGVHHYLVNPVKKKKTRLFDGADFYLKLSGFTGKEYDRKRHKIYARVEGTKNGAKILFQDSGKSFYYYLNTKQLEEIPREEKKYTPYLKNPYPWRKYSEDSTYYVYGQNHNLFLQKNGLPDDEALQLTFDGEPFYSYVNSSPFINTDGTLIADDISLLLSGNNEAKKTVSIRGNALAQPSSGDKENEMAEKRSTSLAYWANDSKNLVIIREDKRRVREMAVINSLAQPRPEYKRYKFPIPGDKYVPQYELFLFDAARGEGRKIDVSKYPDQKLEYARMIPGENSRYVYFLRKSRSCDQIDLCRLDAQTGEFNELITETCSPHFNVPLFSFHILNDGKDIIWWSERSGYGQYYLYDGDGKLKNPITDRSFVAGPIHSIDTLGRSFIFEAYGEDKTINPYYRQYYDVRFDGTRCTLLTPGNGYHDISLSPDRKFLIDSYSRMDMPPKNILRDRQGSTIMELEQASLKDVLERGFKFPEIVQMKSKDGETDLYGVVYRPFNLDKTKKYPIISNVYPGPITDLVPQSFTIDDNYNQSLAQQGFIVINFGYRGASPYRGKEFHNWGYGNLRDYALEDDKHVIEQLAEKYPYIDKDRVGIYGHSGGGFMATSAILTYPEFYKVAVAASGNHDNRIYTQYWGETYQGVKMDRETTGDSTSYIFSVDMPTNLELADRLKGKLLLITGDVDINVHPAQTFRMADALIKANKRFDMMVLPGKDHGLGDRYYTNLVHYYFIEHLLGKKITDADILHHE